MNEVRVQGVPLDPDHDKVCDWYAVECSACGPLAVATCGTVSRTCQQHLREHGAVGITKK
jgi:hypothetical protein